MPFEIKFAKPPTGYSMTTLKPGEYGWACTREFVSSEDGDKLITKLEGFPSHVLGMIQATGSPIPASAVTNMVVIIRRDGSATAYVNEILFGLLIRPKGDVKAGQFVQTDDIADVQRVRIGDLVVPPDAGLIVVFGVGWRRGYFYDFGPLTAGENSARDYDVELMLGQYYTYLLRQDVFKLTEREWKQLLAQRWFPFISLGEQTVKQLLSQIRNGGNADEVLDRVADDLAEMLPAKVKVWVKSPFFEARGESLSTAAERYSAGDFVSSIHVLYPQLEGVMRACHLSQPSPQKATQTALIMTAISYGEELRHSCSLLLPDKFRLYLEGVVFADFDPENPEEVSRHSICHGVAPEGKFDKKEATLAFLVLDQLYYFLSGRDDPSVTEDAAKQLINMTIAEVNRGSVPGAGSPSPVQVDPKAGPGGSDQGQIHKKKSVKRNAPCPCGSGLKYKKCCGAV